MSMGPTPGTGANQGQWGQLVPGHGMSAGAHPEYQAPPPQYETRSYGTQERGVMWQSGRPVPAADEPVLARDSVRAPVYPTELPKFAGSSMAEGYRGGTRLGLAPESRNWQQHPATLTCAVDADGLLNHSHDVTEKQMLLARMPKPKQIILVVRDYFVCWFAPLAWFTAAFLATYYLYFGAALWLGLFLILLLSISLVCIVQKVGYSLGELMLLATILGVFCGLVVYYQYMVYWMNYQGMRTYTNVAGSQPGKAHKDASMIMFTKDTLVDISRSLGFEAPGDADTYCVAPVVDAKMTMGNEIQFWAIGKNCCLPRGSFTCDSAHDVDALSALMVLEPEDLASSGMQWMLGTWPAARERFKKAIEVSEAEYQLKTAPAGERRLLRWAKEPKEMMKAYYDDGVGQSVTVILVYAGCSLVLAALAVKFSKHREFRNPVGHARKKNWEEIRHDDDRYLPSDTERLATKVY